MWIGRWSDESEVCTDQEQEGKTEGEAMVRSGDVLLLVVVLVGMSSLRMPRLWSAAHLMMLLPRLSAWSVDKMVSWWPLRSPRMRKGSRRSMERVEKFGLHPWVLQLDAGGMYTFLIIRSGDLLL